MPTTATAPETEMLVRIKPYNPKIGNLARSHTTHGIKFEEARGWYAVDAELAEKLRTARLGGDPNRGFIFDVCTRAEAQRAQNEEDREHERARAERPITVQQPTTSRDRSSSSSSAADVVAKNNTPIVADGADDEDENDDEGDEGRARGIGRLDEGGETETEGDGDEGGEGGETSQPPKAPKSRSRK